VFLTQLNPMDLREATKINHVIKCRVTFPAVLLL